MGPKTAAKLLQQFGSVGQIWGRVDEVQSEKLRQSLLSHRELIDRNQKVVKLDSGLECWPGWPVMERRLEEAGRLRGFYERMEFHSLLKAMDQPSLLL
jgi:DNA polymerase-1